jgi:hypothetical protein
MNPTLRRHSTFRVCFGGRSSPPMPARPRAVSHKRFCRLDPALPDRATGSQALFHVLPLTGALTGSTRVRRAPLSCGRHGITWRKAT